MLRTPALLLVIALALGTTRDLVCQVACAEPDAAHAASACHESGDMAGTVLQAVQDHCTALDATPSLTAVKVNALQHQSAPPVALRSPTERLTLAPQSGFDRPALSCSSRAHRTAVLRI